MSKKQSKNQTPHATGIMTLTIEAGTLFIPDYGPDFGEDSIQLPDLLAEFEAYCQFYHAREQSKGNLRFILDKNRIGHVQTLTKAEQTKMLFKRTRRTARLPQLLMGHPAPSVKARIRRLASSKTSGPACLEEQQHHHCYCPRMVRLPTIKRLLRQKRGSGMAPMQSTFTGATMMLPALNQDQFAITNLRTEP